MNLGNRFSFAAKLPSQLLMGGLVMAAFALTPTPEAYATNCPSACGPCQWCDNVTNPTAPVCRACGYVTAAHAAQCCEGGICVAIACHESPDNACTNDSCSGGTCQHPAIAGCCNADSECHETPDNPCTTDTCVSHVCHNDPKCPVGQCCNSSTGACGATCPTEQCCDTDKRTCVDYCPNDKCCDGGMCVDECSSGTCCDIATNECVDCCGCPDCEQEESIWHDLTTAFGAYGSCGCAEWGPYILYQDGCGSALTVACSGGDCMVDPQIRGHLVFSGGGTCDFLCGRNTYGYKTVDRNCGKLMISKVFHRTREDLTGPPDCDTGFCHLWDYHDTLEDVCGNDDCDACCSSSTSPGGNPDFGCPDTGDCDNTSPCHN